MDVRSSFSGLWAKVSIFRLVQFFELWHTNGVTSADRKSPQIGELHSDLERLQGELTRRERDAERLQLEKSRLQRKSNRLQRENDRPEARGRAPETTIGRGTPGGSPAGGAVRQGPTAGARQASRTAAWGGVWPPRLPSAPDAGGRDPRNAVTLPTSRGRTPAVLARQSRSARCSWAPAPCEPQYERVLTYCGRLK